MNIEELKELPALPKPWGYYPRHFQVACYTASQMREYAITCIDKTTGKRLNYVDTAGPVEPTVRPCAWLREQRDEYEGPATLAPLMFLGDVGVKPHSALHGATYEPLYNAAALADAVAHERQRCVRILEAYRVPVGNSAAGEMAAGWTMDALREIRDAICGA